SVLEAVIHDDPVPPRRLDRRIPHDLEMICLKCLQKDPGDRYPTADALAADLTAYLGGFPVTARPIGLVRRTVRWAKLHPIRAGLLTAVFAIGVAAGALVPRFQPAQATVRNGVWVERDRDAEAMFEVFGQEVRAYKYSGAPVDFWIELTAVGQKSN